MYRDEIIATLIIIAIVVGLGFAFYKAAEHEARVFNEYAVEHHCKKSGKITGDLSTIIGSDGKGFNCNYLG